MDNVGAFPNGHSALMLSAIKLRLFLEQTLAQTKANQLSELNLSIKNSTDAQVICLAEALKINQTLISLDVSINHQLGAAGSEKVSKALVVFKSEIF